MVAFPIGVGGDTPNRPGPGKRSGDQSWREPPQIRSERPGPSGIDWEKDEKYFSPQPAPKKHYGTKHVDWQDPLPQPRAKKINVRAVPPKTTYTADGMPIPADRWETVEASPHMMHAIKEGDVERGPDPDQEEPTGAEARRTTARSATPRPTPAHERERRHHSTPPQQEGSSSD